jgi:hypothetical protein
MISTSMKKQLRRVLNTMPEVNTVTLQRKTMIAPERYRVKTSFLFRRDYSRVMAENTFKQRMKEYNLALKFKIIQPVISSPKNPLNLPEVDIEGITLSREKDYFEGLVKIIKNLAEFGGGFIPLEVTLGNRPPYHITVCTPTADEVIHCPS